MGYYCGIDLGSKMTSICVINNRRDVLKAVEVRTDKVKDELKKYKGLTCLVEAAPLAEWLCNEVEELGHKITIVCPRKAKAVCGQAKKKTDRREARALAELCRSGWYEAIHRKSEAARNMRSYMTARKQLVDCSVAIGSSIRGILRAHGIRLTEGTDDCSFSDKVRKAAQGLAEPVQRAIAELLQSFELLHAQQRRMYRDLNKGLKMDAVAQVLMTAPGVGPATAAVFVATIDDPSRFPDGEKVASYIGLVPSVYQSGETEYRGRITKSGDKLLRWLLVEAAHVLLSRSGTPCELRDWGLKLQEKKGVGKARVAVARRLCCILWKMWRDHEVFHAESLKQAA